MMHGKWGASICIPCGNSVFPFSRRQSLQSPTLHGRKEKFRAPLVGDVTTVPVVLQYHTGDLASGSFHVYTPLQTNSLPLALSSSQKLGPLLTEAAALTA